MDVLMSLNINTFHIRYAVFTAFAVFCIWFVVFANYGLVDFIKLSKQLRENNVKLAKLKIEKEELLAKINSLKTAIDLNFLEMQARSVLYFSRKGERVFFWK
jgi:cell division protein FtsB